MKTFWDLHDGPNTEPWAPPGVATNFDHVSGGGGLFSTAAQHKLLDVMFGYLAGNKLPCNPDRQDRAAGPCASFEPSPTPTRSRPSCMVHEHHRGHHRLDS